MNKMFPFPLLRFQKEYFIFLLPLFFVLHGFNEHYGKIPIPDVLLLLLTYSVAMLVFALLFFLLFRSFRKAALFSLAFFFVYFFYGASHDWIKKVFPETFITSYRFILPFILIIFIGLFLYLKRTSRVFNRLAIYLNALFLILVVIELAELGLQRLPFSDIIKSATIHNPTAAMLKPCDTCIKEDIHLIILDEYAGQAQLAEELHFDNSAFLNALAARGFYSVSGARSNYNYTELSTASLLSLGYLKDMHGKDDNELYHIGSSIINQNIFTKYLSTAGYRIHNYSIFNVQGLPAFNKHFHPKVNLISSRTLLARLQADIGFHLLYTMPVQFLLDDLQRKIEREAMQNKATMDSVVRMLISNRDTVPDYYYTHLLMPHVPYYFDKEGRFTGLQQYMHPGNPTQRKKAYLEYLQYSNQKVLAFVDQILSKSKRPPIILLMGDHGNRHYTLKKSSHFSTLNAVYFPDRRYKGYYNGMTHVNQLRLLLNNRFGQRLPLLKDSSIFLGK